MPFMNLAGLYKYYVSASTVGISLVITVYLLPNQLIER